MVKALDNPKITHLSVPSTLRFVGILTAILPPKGRRWLTKKFGNDTVFLNYDAAARASYEQRAQSAIGVVEDKP